MRAVAGMARSYLKYFAGAYPLPRPLPRPLPEGRGSCPCRLTMDSSCTDPAPSPFGEGRVAS